MRPTSCLALLLLLLMAAQSKPAYAQAWQTQSEEIADASQDVSDEREPSAPEQQDALPRAYVSLSTGVTQRALRFSAFDGRRELDTGLVPALGLMLRAGVEDKLFWHVELSYRSSVFTTAIASPPLEGAPDTRTMLQTHNFLGGIEPGMRFAGPDSVALSLLAGYAVRALGSAHELPIPRFSLHGPCLRLALELPLVAARLALRIAPELQWIISQTRDIRELARTSGWGMAFGGELSLRLQIVARLSAQLSYREARAHISSAWQAPFSDIQRYLLVEAFIRYF